MPLVADAIQSIREQTYRNFEVVVQDGASTDGTLEYFLGLNGIRGLTVVSQPDAGIGQGFNRALQRCKGDIITSVDADNRLCPHALEVVVQEYSAHPEAAVVYGVCRVINEEGEFVHSFLPAEFELLGLLDGSIVPPFGSSFFSRKTCGTKLYFDEDFPTVPDFALWLRLADLPIRRSLATLAEIRVGPQSSTYRPESYDQQWSYKILAARRYLTGPGRDRALDELMKRVTAGLSLWAVDSMQVIDGPQERIDHFFQQAVQADIRSERFRAVVARARPRLQEIDDALGRQLLMCGLEFIEKGRPADALVYFELLERSQYVDPRLPELLERSRREARHLQDEVDRRDALLVEREAETRAEIARRDDLLGAHEAEARAEVARRDRLIAEQMQEMQAEVKRRDEMLLALHAERAEAVRIRDVELGELRTTVDKLRAELAFATRGFRRWLVGKRQTS
jgi:hypothetical protein